MNDGRFRISAGAALGLAALYLLLDFPTLAALGLAVTAHELGHIAALRLVGARIRQFRAGLSGLCIVYAGRVGYAGQFFAALAGPLAGLGLAAACAALGGKYENGFLYMCAGLSAALSIFNLLPAPPLDGGRMLAAALCSFLPLRRAEAVMRTVCAASGAALLGAGVFFLLRGFGAALIIASVWLMMAQPGIVKSSPVL